MEWIKKHFEKVILGAIALALILTGLFIYMDSRVFLEVFAHRNSTQPPNNTPPTLPIQELQQNIQNIVTPASWTVHDGSLFVSRPYVLREDTLIDLFEDKEMIHPPVPNSWILKYNLDYADPNLLNTDPDRDGFTVLEEYNGGTDPTDSKSIPPYYTKLRLEQYIRIPFRLKFNGTPDEGQTFTINTIDRRGPTQFLKLGEMIDKTPFKLISYQPKNVEKNGIPVDESELILENMENHEKVTLINGKVVDSPTSKAKFIYLLNNAEFEVKKGDAFVIPSGEDTKYKLIDISDNQAVIQNIQTGSQYTIPPLQAH